MAKKLHVTPKGIAIFPKLDQPDTKFDAAGVYATKLKLDGEAAESLKSLLDAAADHAFKEAVEKAEPKKKKSIKRADLPYKAEVDDEGNETGATIFNFKMKASGVRISDGTPWTMRPALFDAKGKPLPKGTKIGGGSTIKVSFEINEFATAIGAGVSLRLNGVQVLDLRTYGGDASSLGFGVEEGYSVEEESTETNESTQDASDF